MVNSGSQEDWQVHKEHLNTPKHKTETSYNLLYQQLGVIKPYDNYSAPRDLEGISDNW